MSGDRTALEHQLTIALSELTQDQLPDFLALLEATRARAWVRLAAPPAPAGLPGTETMLTAQELARIYHTPKSTFYELARTGGVPCVKLGRYVRFDKAVIERALAEAQNSKRRALVPRRKRRATETLGSTATTVLPRDGVAEEREQR